jgi:hypothetical protein
VRAVRHRSGSGAGKGGDTVRILVKDVRQPCHNSATKEKRRPVAGTPLREVRWAPELTAGSPDNRPACRPLGPSGRSR